MIDVRILAVKARQSYAEALKAMIPESKIVYDDRGEYGANNCWYNAKRCWFSPAEAGVTHRLVLSDDAELCDDFMHYVNRAVSFAPDAVWSFYVGWKAEQRIKGTDNTPFVRIRGCKTGGVGILMPIHYALQMVEETDMVFGTEYKDDGGRVGMWCAMHGVPLMTTNPAIVDHKLIPSVIRGHNAKRYSRNYRKDVSQANWSSSEYVETPLIPSYLWTEDIKAKQYWEAGKNKERAR